MQRLAGSTGLFVLCVAAIAQTDRGTITGTISDPAGAVIAEASVEARNMATGAAYHVATIGTGNYTVSQLPAGNCEISITVPGFKRYVRQGPWLANPNNVYPGFPATQQLFQALRSYPQWTGVPLFLEPPLGVTWYDSLQAKVTKRLSRGLMVDSAFTWQKQLNLGVGAGTAYLTPAPNLINDVFNRQQLKQISGFNPSSWCCPSAIQRLDSLPIAVLVRRCRGRRHTGNLGGMFRYQSGQMIRTPPSNNGLFRQLARTDNPANWGGANTFWNRVPRQNPLLFDPNCKCFDPTTQLVLNPNAWTDAPVGQFVSSAPFYNDYRWQRQRAESLSLGRTFKLAREGKINFDVRAELFNVLNRLSLANPLPVSVSGFPPPENNPAAQTVRNQFGALTAGYGFHQHVQPRGRRRQQRSGQIVGRLSF